MLPSYLTNKLICIPNYNFFLLGGDYKFIFLISDDFDPYLAGFTITMASNTDIDF